MNMAMRIKNRRKVMGLTQEELAAKLGVQKSAVAKYENGRVENIKRSIIQKMAEILDCDPAYLLGFSDEVKRQSTTSDLQTLFQKLTPEGQKQALEYLNYLLSKDEYKR